MIDTGVKASILRNLRERGASLTLHPCTASAEQLLDGDPDAIFLANGPGDPAALDYIVATVRGSSASSRCTASASATSCCAARSASRPTSSRSATTAPTTRSRT